MGKSKSNNLPPPRAETKKPREHNWKAMARRTDEYKKNRDDVVEGADGKSELRTWLPKCRLTVHHLYECKNPAEYKSCEGAKAVSWFEHKFLETLVGKTREESAQKLRAVGDRLIAWADEIFPNR